jgi:hypothetical protein
MSAYLLCKQIIVLGPSYERMPSTDNILFPGNQAN